MFAVCVESFGGGFHCHVLVKWVHTTQRTMRRVKQPNRLNWMATLFTPEQMRWKSVLSYIGTTHNCSKYIYRSKNVLVPKWAKKMRGLGIQRQAAVIIETQMKRRTTCSNTVHAPEGYITVTILPTCNRRGQRQKVSREASGSFSALFMALW